MPIEAMIEKVVLVIQNNQNTPSAENATPLTMANGNSSDSNNAAITTTIITSASRSEEHTSELQSLMRISYAVFCLHKNNKNHRNNSIYRPQHQNKQTKT